MDTRMLILADDFTGACDTAVQFARPNAAVPVEIVFSSSDSPNHHVDSARAADGKPSARDRQKVVVLDTESREVDPTEAAVRVGAVSIAGAPEIIYKKIDSTLRGNIAVEVDALRKRFPGRTVLLAPAFPAAGRTTSGGLCLVHGRPVHETEFGTDPTRPVPSSELSHYLSDCVARLATPGTLDDAMVTGADAIVVDAETETDLRTIAGFALQRADTLLLVGSAGLAAAISEILLPSGRTVPTYSEAHSGSQAPEAVGNHTRGPVLGVVGSRSERSRKQLDNLVASGRADIVSVGQVDADNAVHAALSLLDRGRSVVLVPSDGRWPSAESVALSLANAAKRVLDERGGVPLFMTGGATAVAVTRGLGSDGVLVHREIAPGIPAVELTRRDGQVITAVTKAGGFGDDDAMVRAFSCLEEGTCLDWR
jgi:uncharacterized protein YgbK (DUF1537 family)